MMSRNIINIIQYSIKLSTGHCPLSDLSHQYPVFSGVRLTMSEVFAGEIHCNLFVLLLSWLCYTGGYAGLRTRAQGVEKYQN